MMFIRTSSFLVLVTSFLLSGVVNGRRLADQRTLEKDLFVVVVAAATNEVTKRNLLEVQEKQHTRYIKEEEGEEEEEEELPRKADNDNDDLEINNIDYHEYSSGFEFETAIYSPDSFITNGYDEEDIFTAAASIDVFKNIDPTKFKWVNSDNIKPGATTCGFLHTTLGAEPGVNYPIIKVYICMTFATNQPAPKGNIVMHCGGPSSVSGCGIDMGSEDIGKENVANYNIIGIDQRGLGRSWPSLYHEECNRNDADLEPDDDGKYSEADIQYYLDGQKDFVERCWTCTDCDYQFNNIEQPDGDVRSFHFLEYSGTRQLAEDLNRFRVLIDAPALSLYGISYGTTVMGTYATIFPNNVDKFILDGSSTPYNTIDQISRSAAVGQKLRYNYLKYTCWAARLKNRDNCPVEPDNIAKCAVNAGYLMDLINNFDSLTEEELNELPISVSDIPDIVKEFSTKANSPIDFLLLLLTKDPSTMGKLCSTDDADWDTLNEFIKNFDSPQKRGIGLDSIDCDNYDQPSDEDNGICFDPINGDVPYMVRGQDYSGGVSAYDDDVFINHVLAFQDEYGSEYIRPMQIYIVFLATNYYWPKNVPLPILGSPLVNGIITGQLYDRATPYAWSSEMREHFPSTSLLTSQSIFHGISNGDAYGPCQKYVTKYLETGVINWTDGTVCGEQFPYFGGEIRK